MSSTRIGSALSACSNQSKSESVEIITSNSDMDDIEEKEQNNSTSKQNDTTQLAQPQPSFLWRVSSGAIGGVYNAASGAAGMGYNTTKWVLGKGVEVGSNVVVASKDMSGSVLIKTAEVGSSIVSKLPVPAKLKGKDKTE